MPDIKKSVKFQKEQNKIITTLFNLLPLDDSNSFVRYNLEQNENIKQQILDLIPDIKKYFSITNMKSVQDPDKSKYPWLCIIRSILKHKYNIISKDCIIKIDNKPIHTRKYYIIEKKCVKSQS